MVQLRRVSRFAGESLEFLRRFGQVLPRHLQRHHPVKFRVVGFVDCSKTAAPDSPDDPKTPDIEQLFGGRAARLGFDLSDLGR
jgi:hypothetical protein